LARFFENIIEIILNIFWARTFEFLKRAKAPLCLVIKINQRLHQELYLKLLLELWF